jgi:hypothetical protein
MAQKCTFKGCTRYRLNGTIASSSSSSPHCSTEGGGGVRRRLEAAPLRAARRPETANSSLSTCVSLTCGPWRSCRCCGAWASSARSSRRSAASPCWATSRATRSSCAPTARPAWRRSRSGYRSQQPTRSLGRTNSSRGSLAAKRARASSTRWGPPSSAPTRGARGRLARAAAARARRGRCHLHVGRDRGAADDPAVLGPLRQGLRRVPVQEVLWVGPWERSQRRDGG